MTANPYRPDPKRIAVKDMIEEMREELRIERGEKLKKPMVKPKGKPKRPSIPSNPYPKRPLKPKRKNIFAQKFPKMSEKEFVYGLKLYNKSTEGKKNPVNIKKRLKEIKGYAHG
jgi:hypothetical protein